MRGTILNFDQLTGQGHISGEDNARYTFAGVEWKTDLLPHPGQLVDFQPSEGHATDIYRMSSSVGQAGGKNKIVAALLAFFLGGLGIHKFYLGRNGAGIIMLLASLFGIILLFIPTLVMGLIAFAEAIIYLVTPDDEFERKYVVGDKSWF